MSHQILTIFSEWASSACARHEGHSFHLKSTHDSGISKQSLEKSFFHRKTTNGHENFIFKGQYYISSGALLKFNYKKCRQMKITRMFCAHDVCYAVS